MARKPTYYKNVQVTADEALDEHGAMKDGYSTRVSLMDAAMKRMTDDVSHQPSFHDSRTEEQLSALDQAYIDYDGLSTMAYADS